MAAHIKKRSTAERKFNEMMSDNSLRGLQHKLELTNHLIKAGYKGLDDIAAKEVYITSILMPGLWAAALEL